MSKRILSLVLALVMVLGTFGTVFAETAAVEANNAKIEWLVEQDMVKGDASGDLMLDKLIDRASTARMIAVALGKEAEAEGLKNVISGFPDMTTAHWANGYANLAAGMNLIVGDEKGNFMPAKDITYGEITAVLVRLVLGRDLTAAERGAAGSWVAPYVAKATELNLFDGVSVPNFEEKAIRKTVLEMFYNAIVNMEVGNYSVVKGIVLENYRVEKIAKDEVVVEVLKELQVANYAGASRQEKGTQLRLNVSAKVGDVENLLGRVADFTIDKNNNVVAIKMDETYKVETGKFKATKNKMGSYTVEVAERYKDSDERIFRTYFNNDALAYEDFYKDPETIKKAEKDRKEEFTVEYAKVTVKNGKVLFIDAFNFKDIAPVKEVKLDGAEVFVYNDARDGGIKRYDLAATAKVLTVKDGKIGMGTRADISENDVIHEFDGGYIVRKDALVNGTFEKITENKDGIFVNVDGETYLVSIAANKQPVYSYDSKDFYTLSASRADAVLREFRNEKVSILKDLAGNLQYIGSEIELGEFMALITKVSGNDVRVLKADGEKAEYRATLDTKYVGTNTGHQNLQRLNAGDLVYVSVDKEKIEKIVRFSNVDDKVNALDTKDITVKNDDFRILSGTNVFVALNDGTYEVRSIKDVKDAYDANVKAGKEVKAYVVSGRVFNQEADPRRDAYTTRADEAHTIVFTQIEIEGDYKENVVKFNGFTDKQEREIEIVFEDNTKETRAVDKSLATFLRGLRVGDIIEIQETKNDKKEIMEAKLLIEAATLYKENVFSVDKNDRFGNLVLKDRNGAEAPLEFVVTKDTVIFNGSLSNAKKVSYVLEKDKNNNDTKYVQAILVREDNQEVTGRYPGSVAEPVKGELKAAYQVGTQVWVRIDKEDYKYVGSQTLNQLENLVGTVTFETIMVNREEVVTLVERFVPVNADEVAADRVIADIAKLPVVTKENLATARLEVAAVRNAYNALSRAAQEMVVNLDKLEAAEAAIIQLDKPEVPAENPENPKATITVLQGGVLLGEDAIAVTLEAKNPELYEVSYNGQMFTYNNGEFVGVVKTGTTVNELTVTKK